MARGNPFSFRPLQGPGGASHHIGCGLPRRFAARNDNLFACGPVVFVVTEYDANVDSLKKRPESAAFGA